MKIKNILLALSLATFAIGFSDLQENLFFWMGRPVGALLFGIYMIFIVLEDATNLYDRQETEKSAALDAGKNFISTEKQEPQPPALSLTTDSFARLQS
jgi:hypothetical protein